MFHLLIPFLLAMPGQGKCLTLEEAIAQKKVVADVKYVPKSPKYNRAIMLTLKNNSGKPACITVLSGNVFAPDDTTMQNIMTVEPHTFRLAAGETAKKELMAYCINKNRRTPTVATTLVPVGPADSALQELAKSLDSAFVYDDVGQAFVWVVTDDSALPFATSDNERYNAVMRKLRNIKGQSDLAVTTVPVNSVATATSETTRKQAATREQIKLTITYNFQLAEGGPVSQGLYNPQGKLILLFWDNLPLTAGHHTGTTTWDATGLPPGRYFYRSYHNGRKLMEMIVTI